MTGFFAEGDLTPNTIEQARLKKAASGGYINLTSSNPTSNGLLFPPEILQEASAPYWSSRRYSPDPRGLLSARQAIQRYYSRRSPTLELSLSNLFITASTSEAYSLLFALLTEPGDNLLAPDVTYPLFEYLAALHHIELRPYHLNEANGWQIDQDHLLSLADERTRGVLIVSPHNPTGMIVQSPVPALTQLGLPVICDEVFAEFTYHAPTTPPLGTLHPELTIFHLNGISKLFALPDMKLGWIALTGPEPERYAGRLELLNDTFLGASSLIQSMLPTLFERGWPFVEAMRERVRSNLSSAIAMLDRVARVDLLPPDGGYYLFPRILRASDEEALVLRLLEAGVLVHPGYFYGDVRGTHLMISCLTEPDQLAAGLEIVVRELNAL